MPTYRYRCQHCGDEFDVWQSIKDDALRTHNQGCGGELAKVFSAAGIVLKGSGFYRNDSRSAARSGAAKEKESTNGDSSKESSKESAKDTKSTDSKSGDSKSGDSKSSDSKSSDSKSGSPSTAGTKSS
jgi:putative FmdB family regulatory protein